MEEVGAFVNDDFFVVVVARVCRSTVRRDAAADHIHSPTDVGNYYNIVEPGALQRHHHQGGGVGEGRTLSFEISSQLNKSSAFYVTTTSDVLSRRRMQYNYFAPLTTERRRQGGVRRSLSFIGDVYYERLKQIIRKTNPMPREP